MQDPKERMMSRITVTASGCWVIDGCRDKYGYGKFHLDGVQELAHRAAYMLFVGQPAPGMFVCHECDNRPCCNPDHLFEGTAKDNADDCIAKGRNAPVPMLKGPFTDEKKALISGEFKALSNRAAAKAVGVSHETVRRFRATLK